MLLQSCWSVNRLFPKRCWLWIQFKAGKSRVSCHQMQHLPSSWKHHSKERDWAMVLEIHDSRWLECCPIESVRGEEDQGNSLSFIAVMVVLWHHWLSYYWSRMSYVVWNTVLMVRARMHIFFYLVITWELVLSLYPNTTWYGNIIS